MSGPTTAAVRYALGWSRDSESVATRTEVLGDPPLARADLYREVGPTRPRPGWVLLHGLTRPAHRHPSLVRFARALASAHNTVLVPEIPCWRDLEMDPLRAQTVIRAAVEYLADRTEVTQGGIVLAGFSFGCPQALIVASEPEIRPLLRGVVGFGGYADLGATVSFLLTGRHELDGEVLWRRPDPYGRWVVGANYLPQTEGCEGSTDVAEALKALATKAGERQIMSWDPVYDGAKAELREGIDPSRRDLFDLFAPPADREPDPDMSVEMATRVAAAARRVDPALDATASLGSELPPVRLVHGRHDHLIPFTETLRLEVALRERADCRAWITDLYAHSGESEQPMLSQLSAQIHFLWVIREILKLRA